MIKLISSLPNEIEIVCTTEDELEFCNSHKDKILDTFVRDKTKGKFETFNEYLKWCYAEPEFGEISIIAKWNEQKEWGLGWNITTIKELQCIFNDMYEVCSRE